MNEKKDWEHDDVKEIKRRQNELYTEFVLNE